MTARAHHLADDRLFDCYLSRRSGDPLDPPTAEHLADCAVCGAHYAELAAFMDGLRSDAVAETDAVFGPDQLRAQALRISNRLEHVGHPARVIAFPGSLSGRDSGVSTTRFAPKWLAAAAAAGVFIGVAVGASYKWEFPSRPTSRFAAAARQIPQVRPTRLTPVGTRGSAPATVADDDAFLSDLEAALERPHTRELLPFDALTPHVRDANWKW